MRTYGKIDFALRYCLFVAIAYGLSSNRRAIRWKPVIGGLALQFLLAVFILRTQMGLALFSWLGDLIVQFFAYSDAGSIFVFGENFRDFFFAFRVGSIACSSKLFPISIQGRRA